MRQAEWIREWRACVFAAAPTPRTLIVDGEPLATGLLEALLRSEDVHVERGAIAAAAGRLQRESFDVVVMDAEACAGEDGTDLRAAAERSGASLVLLARPSDASAIALGVSLSAEVLLLPLAELPVLTRRFRRLVARRRADDLRHRLVAEIIGAVRSGRLDRADARKAREAYGVAKEAVSRCPQVLCAGDETDPEARALVQALAGVGVAATTATGLADVLGRAAGRDAPLVLVLPLDHPEVARTITAVAEVNPLVDVVAVGTGVDAERLAEVADAGVTPLVLGDASDTPPFVQDVERRLARSGRRRTFLRLLDVLAETFEGLPRSDAIVEALGTGVWPAAHDDGPREGHDADEPLDVDVDVGPPDLRRWPRVATRLPARVEGGEVESVIRDVSATGLFLHLDPPPPLGARLVVEIEMENDEGPGLFRAIGQVVRRASFEPDPAGSTGVGLRIVGGGQAPLQPLVDAVAGAAA